MKKKDIEKIVFRQLALYYLVPAIAAIAISAVIAIYAGNQFVRYTGATGSGVLLFWNLFVDFSRNLCGVFCGNVSWI